MLGALQLLTQQISAIISAIKHHLYKMRTRGIVQITDFAHIKSRADSDHRLIGIVGKQDPRLILMFTQQWLFLLVLAYTTERVLYRPDPWKQLRSTTVDEQDDAAAPTNADYRAMLEAWLEQNKPYLNPDFQLIDLRQVLPLNRTYLSQFINTEYGCSFYQWVNGLRISEAKRLMTEQPELKMQDVAKQCGFSSRSVFTQVFTRETGVTPSEWK